MHGACVALPLLGKGDRSCRAALRPRRTAARPPAPAPSPHTARAHACACATWRPPCSAADIVAGRRKPILSLVYQMMRYHALQVRLWGGITGIIMLL